MAHEPCPGLAFDATAGPAARTSGLDPEGRRCRREEAAVGQRHIARTEALEDEWQPDGFTRLPADEEVGGGGGGGVPMRQRGGNGKKGGNRRR